MEETFPCVEVQVIAILDFLKWHIMPDCLKFKVQMQEMFQHVLVSTDQNILLEDDLESVRIA